MWGRGKRRWGEAVVGRRGCEEDCVARVVGMLEGDLGEEGFVGGVNCCGGNENGVGLSYIVEGGVHGAFVDRRYSCVTLKSGPYDRKWARE